MSGCTAHSKHKEIEKPLCPSARAPAPFASYLHLQVEPTAARCLWGAWGLTSLRGSHTPLTPTYWPPAIREARPPSAWPGAGGIWHLNSPWGLVLLHLVSLDKSGVRGKEEGKGRAGLTSCSESPSMISDTSCSLRAADMESPPLPLCPTLLGKGKGHSETGALLCAVLRAAKRTPCPSFLTCANSHLLHRYNGTFHTQPGPPTVFSRAHFIAPQQ